MSNHQNEVIQEQAIESYEEKLNNMNEEELLNEFCETFDCEPVDFYTNPKNYNNKEMWIFSLVDSFSVRLFENPELVLSFEAKMDKHISKINALTKQINRN